MNTIEVLGIEKTATKIYCKPIQYRDSCCFYVSSVGTEPHMRKYIRRAYKDSRLHKFSTRESRAIVISNIMCNPTFIIRKAIEL